jgi:hypothetical protein
MTEDSNRPNQGMLKAILTDVQFWVPALVLAAGIALLIVLH